MTNLNANTIIKPTFDNEIFIKIDLFANIEIFNNETQLLKNNVNMTELEKEQSQRKITDSKYFIGKLFNRIDDFLGNKLQANEKPLIGEMLIMQKSISLVLNKIEHEPEFIDGIIGNLNLQETKEVFENFQKQIPELIQKSMDDLKAKMEGIIEKEPEENQYDLMGI